MSKQKSEPPQGSPSEKGSGEAAPSGPPPTLFKRFVDQFGGIIVAALVVLSARASLADHYYVPSGSMLPTVQIGDRIVVDKRAFGLRFPASDWYMIEYGDPKRGDVVVLSSPEDGRVLLKRIVGLPGDDLEIKDGYVHVAGKALPMEPSGEHFIEDLEGHKHLVSLKRGGGPEFERQQLPPRMYLVVGDNRGDSRDGRYFGLVPRDILLGRAVRMYLHADEWVWRPVDP